jgi:drug/metabolite transporter (DMT)-like permease
LIYLILVFQQLIASTTHLVAQDVTQHTDPLVVLLFRASIASIALGALIAIRKSSKDLPIARSDKWRLLVVGLLNVPINQFLYLEGVKRTSPANSALLYAMTPLFVFLLTLGVHRERASWKKWVGIGTAFCGVVLIMMEHGAEQHPSYMDGNILIFIAVIAWSLYTFLGKPLVEKYGAVRITALNMIIGTIAYLPFGLIFGDVSAIHAIAGVDWLRILYLGIMAYGHHGSLVRPSDLNRTVCRRRGDDIDRSHAGAIGVKSGRILQMPKGQTRTMHA